MTKKNDCFKKMFFILSCFITLSLLFSGATYAQHVETGLASFYSDNLQGRMTASGEIYDTLKMTAAHRSLAFNTKIKVTNLENKKSVIVIINDRGPFVEGRIIDLSRAAAEKLGFVDKGVVKVTVEVIGAK
jgi:rare lipoprotein A